jgi:peptide-methionine (S)-S-oxide reductase
MHDPTTKNQQGGDRGTQYRSVIFYRTPEEKAAAERGTQAAQLHYGNARIETTIEQLGDFWLAEDYHQDYLDKNPHGCNGTD